MGDGIVAHVDRGIAERLDQELRIPGQLGSQPKGSGAGPLVQPIQNTLQPILSFLSVRVESILVSITDMFESLLLPRLLPIVDVPLTTLAHSIYL